MVILLNFWLIGAGSLKWSRMAGFLWGPIPTYTEGPQIFKKIVIALMRTGTSNDFECFFFTPTRGLFRAVFKKVEKNLHFFWDDVYCFFQHKKNFYRQKDDE